MKRAAIILMTLAVVLAAAQAKPAGIDTVSRAEVVLAARQALEAASRNLGRWLTIVIIIVLVAAAVAAWRIWTLGGRLSRLEDLRAAWDTRFAETTDEVLRMKRKVAEAESMAERLEADIAALRPADPEAATAQVAMVQSELVAVRERLDRAEEKLEAVADHTVVTTRERAAVEELVKTAGQARVAAEAAAARAERTAALAESVDSLRVGNENLARQQYAAAVLAYTRCLKSIEKSGADNPEMHFHALHNRALANLRQQEFDAVLVDAAELENVASERTRGAARLLAGVARLGQGAVAQALRDFADAIERDAGARAVIVQDEDIAAWVKANPKKAAPIKRFIKSLDKKPEAPQPPTVKKRPRRR
jgi:tetratricopeptide (TPR) repeat protein